MKKVRVIKSMSMKDIETGAEARLHPGEYEVIHHRNPEFGFARDWVQINGTKMGMDAELFWELIKVRSMVDLAEADVLGSKFKVYIPIEISVIDGEARELSVISRGEYILEAVENPMSGSLDPWLVIEGTLKGQSAFAWFSMGVKNDPDYPFFGFSIQKLEEVEE